jgi:hypothetical protein
MAAEFNELDEKIRFVSWMRVEGMLELALGHSPIDWDDRQEEEQLAFGEAFVACQKAVAEAEGSPYDALARTTYQAYQRATSPIDFVEWRDINPELKLKWEFLVRHMVNLLIFDAEDDGSVQPHEDQITSLFSDKLRVLQETPI